MAHPMIGSQNRQYARDILQCGTARAKVAWIGDSIMTISGDGLQGVLPRMLNVSAFDGIEITGPSQYIIYQSAVNPPCGTTVVKNPGDATTIPDFPGGKQNYAPLAAYECLCDENAVPAPENLLSNRALTIAKTTSTAGKQYLRLPSTAISTRYGDVWLNRLNAAGSLKLRVCFFAGPHCDDSSRIFLQATNGEAPLYTKNIAQSEPFNLYQETAGIVMQELTIPATFAGDGIEDTSTYWPGIKFAIRITEGAAMDGKMIIPVGVEMCVTGSSGYSQAFYFAGGASAATFVNETNYDRTCWQKLAASGVTHCVISLIANGDAEAVANHETLVSYIRSAAPAMKFIVLAPYNFNAGTSAKADAIYAWAEANGHLWLSLENWFAPNAVIDQSFVSAHTPGVYYYESDGVTNGGMYYLCINPHTAGDFATELANLKWEALTTDTAWVTETPYVRGDFRKHGTPVKYYKCLIPHTSGVFDDDLAAGKWILKTTLDTNALAQHSAGNRNFVMNDGVHFNRSRGVTMYASGIMALLNIAAAMPLAQDVRAGRTFGPENEQKGTMPSPMVRV